MTIKAIRDIFAWCSAINLGLLLFWVLWLTLAHDWVYRVHTKWFKLSIERFDAIHYAGITLFKICIFFFNIVPYIALLIIE